MQPVPFSSLGANNGADGRPIWISVLGIVYDCSTDFGKQFFGANGPYKAMAGADASFALAQMSLSREHMNSIRLTDLPHVPQKTMGETTYVVLAIAYGADPGPARRE